MSKCKSKEVAIVVDLQTPHFKLNESFFWLKKRDFEQCIKIVRQFSGNICPLRCSLMQDFDMAIGQPYLISVSCKTPIYFITSALGGICGQKATNLAGGQIIKIWSIWVTFSGKLMEQNIGQSLIWGRGGLHFPGCKFQKRQIWSTHSTIKHFLEVINMYVYTSLKLSFD